MLQEAWHCARGCPEGGPKRCLPTARRNRRKTQLRSRFPGIACGSSFGNLSGRPPRLLARIRQGRRAWPTLSRPRHPRCLPNCARKPWMPASGPKSGAPATNGAHAMPDRHGCRCSGFVAMFRARCGSARCMASSTSKPSGAVGAPPVARRASRPTLRRGSLSSRRSSRGSIERHGTARSRVWPKCGSGPISWFVSSTRCRCRRCTPASIRRCMGCSASFETACLAVIAHGRRLGDTWPCSMRSARRARHGACAGSAWSISRLDARTGPREPPSSPSPGSMPCVRRDGTPTTRPCAACRPVGRCRCGPMPSVRSPARSRRPARLAAPAMRSPSDWWRPVRSLPRASTRCISSRMDACGAGAGW